MKNSEGSIHKKIRSIKASPEEKSIMFAAVRSLHLRGITINILHTGADIQLSGVVEKQRSMIILEDLGIVWKDGCYYFSRSKKLVDYLHG